MAQVLIYSKTHGSHVAFCDDQDYPLISQYKWHLHLGKRTYYARTNIEHKKVFMHILIVGDGNFDHVDHNGLNNCRYNLRPFVNNQNHHNRRGVSASSQYKNVYWDKKAKKWRVTICYDYIRQHIGYFDEEILAALAADDAMIIMQGNFSCLNFPTMYGA